MRHFQAGQFDRHSVAPALRVFCPTESKHRIEEVDLAALHARGKRLILLDVDNTLTLWKSEEISEEVNGWVAGARALGFKFCLISNTRHPARLARLADLLGMPYLTGKMKPSRQMYIEALKKFEVTADEAIMIGDQLLTDILGANRSGIEAIWLMRLGAREFPGTRFNRWLERALLWGLYRALSAPIDAPSLGHDAEVRKPFWERTLVQQLLKFALVGGSAFIIDAGLSVFLISHARWGDELLSQRLGAQVWQNFSYSHLWATGPEKAAAPILFGAATLTAMFYTFVLNRRWTFEVRGKEGRLSQLRRFYTVTLLGALFNTMISSFVLNLLTGHSTRSTVLSKAVAAVVVAVWNFSGQRFYAFRPSREPLPTGPPS